MRKWLLPFLLVLVAAFAYKENEGAFDSVPKEGLDAPIGTALGTPASLPAVTAVQPASVAAPALQIIETSNEVTPEPWQNGDQIQGLGRVTRILADDNDGSRHQRFILTLPTGRTLLVAHNIDLAPRLNSLRTGDTVAFYGEYIWNDKGGILHWTHHDPKGKHAGGWLKHNNELYQ